MPPAIKKQKVEEKADEQKDNKIKQDDEPMNDAGVVSDEDDMMPEDIEALIKMSQERDEELAENNNHAENSGGGGYNSMKSFNGQYYTGMRIGGSHKWNYDQGIWNETKMEPDLWKIDFETHKRRAKQCVYLFNKSLRFNHNLSAPKGSGVPVGTQYHWFVVAHQYVEKLDEDTYSTRLVGHKYKLAHKNVNSGWDIKTVKGQRERETHLLKDAQRRVEGLPPVHASEKIKEGNTSLAKGQVTLESMFASSPARKTEAASSKADVEKTPSGKSSVPAKASSSNKRKR